MKRVGLVLLAVLMVAGLTGCSKDDEDADPVGTWSMTGDWECDGTLHFAVWHINPDGTFSDSTVSGNLEVDRTGDWGISKSTFTLTYVSGTTYIGEVDGDFMSGTATFAGGIETGCWSATRTSATP